MKKLKFLKLIGGKYIMSLYECYCVEDARITDYTKELHSYKDTPLVLYKSIKEAVENSELCKAYSFLRKYSLAEYSLFMDRFEWKSIRKRVCVCSFDAWRVFDEFKNLPKGVKKIDLGKETGYRYQWDGTPIEIPAGKIIHGLKAMYSKDIFYTILEPVRNADT